MRALSGYIGIIAVSLSICGFIVPLIFPGVLSPIEPLLCPEGSHISTGSRPGQTSINLFCRAPDGRVVEDIQWKVLIPLFILCFGGIALSRAAYTGRANQALPVPMPTPYTRTDDPSEDPEAVAKKLQRLKTALDAGLITQTEYDAKRQEILDDYYQRG